MSTYDDNVSLTALQRINHVCVAFEAEWRSGERPSITEYLADHVEPLRSVLLREMLVLDLEYRLAAGETPLNTEYGGIAPDIDAIFHLALDQVQGTRTIARNDESTNGQPSATTMHLPQQEMGRFTLLERLGSGGFGTVWKARDSQLDRIVALKLPRSPVLSNEEFQRFEREAKTAAQLRHDGIVGLLDIGKEDGHLFLVSEYIDGVTLADWLTDQQLTNREAANMAHKIAMAVGHAHANNVVHRDLKPSNVIVDRDGKPHLTDFGLAKRLTGDATLTMESLVAGTPMYMSPEQAKGKSNSADGRSDIYSLGVILYELLTGETPFRGETMAVLRQIVDEEPVLPSQLNSRVHLDLQTITMKCLEKDQSRRYQTAQEVADELNRFLRQEPILARPVGRIERSWRWCKRNRLVASLCALLAVVLLGGTLISSFYAVEAGQRAAESRELAEAEGIARDKAERAAYYGAMQMLAADIREDDYSRLATTLMELKPHYRGWEWGYLWTAARLPEWSKHAEPEQWFSVAANPNGRSFVTAGHGNITLWNGAGNSKVWQCGALKDEWVKGQYFSTNCNEIIVWTNVGDLHVLDAKDGNVLTHMDSVGIRCLVAHPTNGLVYAGTNNGEIIVVDTTTSKVISRHNLGSGHINYLAISQNGRRLACGRSATPKGENEIGGRHIHVVETDTFEKLHDIYITSNNEGIRGLLFLDDIGVLLAPVAQVVHLFSLESGETIRHLVGHDRVISVIAASEDHKRVLTGDRGGEVNIYDADKWSTDEGSDIEPDATVFSEGFIGDLACLEDDRVLVLRNEKQLQLWSATSPHQLRPSVEIDQPAYSGTYHVEYRDDGQLIVASGWWAKERVLAYYSETGEKHYVRLQGIEDVSTDHKIIRFRPKTMELAAHTNSSISFFNTEQITGDVEYPLLWKLPVRSPLYDFCFDPSGNKISLIYQDGTLDVRDVRIGSSPKTLIDSSKGGSARGARFSPDGSILAYYESSNSGGWYGQVSLWNVNSERVVYRLPAYGTHPGRATAFHPRLPLVAAARNDGTIAIFDYVTGEIQNTMQGQADDPANCLHFSPDGDRLLSGSNARLLKIWDWRLEKTLLTLPCGWYVLSAEYSPDGRSIATNTLNGMRIWKAEAYKLNAAVSSE